MYEAEVKLSAMHLGGRKRVLYKGILKLNLCECILYFYGKICGVPENCPQIPEKCLSYS